QTGAARARWRAGPDGPVHGWRPSWPARAVRRPAASVALPWRLPVWRSRTARAPPDPDGAVVGGRHALAPAISDVLVLVLRKREGVAVPGRVRILARLVVGAPLLRAHARTC